jgi:hypothetical protein
VESAPTAPRPPIDLIAASALAGDDPGSSRTRRVVNSGATIMISRATQPMAYRLAGDARRNPWKSHAVAAAMSVPCQRK